MRIHLFILLSDELCGLKLERYKQCFSFGPIKSSGKSLLKSESKRAEGHLHRLLYNRKCF